MFDWTHTFTFNFLLKPHVEDKCYSEKKAKILRFGKNQRRERRGGRIFVISKTETNNILRIRSSEKTEC